MLQNGSLNTFSFVPMLNPSIPKDLSQKYKQSRHFVPMLKPSIPNGQNSCTYMIFIDSGRVQYKITSPFSSKVYC